MQLYLLRHGHAVPADPAHGVPDDLRPLSERGGAEARAIAAGLRRAGVRPGALFTSPLRRAVETATLVADGLGVAPEDVIERDSLRPGCELDAVADLVLEAGDAGQVLVVGHNPDFSQIAADLVGRNVHIHLGTAGLVRVDLDAPVRPRRGTLIWLLSPALFEAE